MVQVLISNDGNGILSVFVEIDESLGKIQDIEMSIKSKSGTVGLKSIQTFRYYRESIIEPYMTTADIDLSILDFQRFISTDENGVDQSKVVIPMFKGDSIILRWRDAENKLLTKKYSYQRYREIFDGLSKGPIKVEGPNHYVSDMRL